jgi:DNA-binding GntR family transcriptional regulator
MEAKNKLSSFDKVYRGIFKKLYEGKLLPGQRLVTPALVREFGASRNTVREVLNRLCAIGITSAIRNQSPTIRSFSRSEMNGLLDVVSVLLGLAARSAASAPQSAARLLEFQRAYDDVSAIKIENDLTKFVEARERYYRALLKVSENWELIRIFPTIHVHLMRLQLRNVPLVAQSAQSEDYAAITAAVLASDPRAAAAAAHKHVGNMIAAVNDLPDAMFAPETSID